MGVCTQTLRRVHTLHSQRLEFLCSPDCRDISSQLHHLLLALKESCQWLNLGAWETGKLATSAEGDVGQAEENEEDGEEDVLLTRLGSWAPREKSMKYQGSFMSFVEDTFGECLSMVASRAPFPSESVLHVRILLTWVLSFIGSCHP